MKHAGHSASLFMPLKASAGVIMLLIAAGCGGGSAPPAFVQETLDETGVTTTNGTVTSPTTPTSSEPSPTTPVTGSGSTVTPLTADQLADTYSSAASDLGLAINGFSGAFSGLGFPETAELPTGAATYVGGSAIALDDGRPNNSFLSTARLEVDFATQTITGALTNTVEATIENGVVTGSQPFTGTIDVNNGRLAQVDFANVNVSSTGPLNGLVADLEGTLIGDGESLRFDIDLTGGFGTGPRGEGIAAGLDGKVFSSDVGSSSPPVELDALGALFAPRQ